MTLEADFNKAAEEAKSLPSAITNDEKLQLYALYKQATHGDCDTSRPMLLDITGTAKWDAWDKVKGTSKDDAMKGYIALVAAIKAKYA